MRAVVQRCSCAEVKVDGNTVARIGRGVLVLAAFAPGDTANDIDYIIDKTYNLRIFSDANDKMNLSVKDMDGGMLFVPNFTLYGDARHGRRPGYTDAAQPELAEALFEELKKRVSALELKEAGFGIFQADMKVELINDGPITLLLDSSKMF
ncbi:D-aminoacyl-tRNA deacylase [Lachnospiraceae bacterium NSJ-143]|nr:D-aminoacyl-tRNA deacylase [Lachnospiraceae bacterium NSJ-143]